MENGICKTILIVDDAIEHISLCKAILQQQYTIIAASSCEDAIDLLKNGLHPDLVITDVILPNKSGFELCQYIRNDFSVRDIPVIFISGLIAKEIRFKELQTGNVDFISKPFNLGKLREMVKQKLNMECDYSS